jgi:predicted anti-sigma-YlaC factor YlaD
MDCLEVKKQIELYILDGLAGPQREAIKTHLATCPACGAIEADYRLLAEMVKQAEGLDFICEARTFRR